MELPLIVYTPAPDVYTKQMELLSVQMVELNKLYQTLSAKKNGLSVLPIIGLLEQVIELLDRQVDTGNNAL